jgi:hypothetical protein
MSVLNLFLIPTFEKKNSFRNWPTFPWKFGFE